MIPALLALLCPAHAAEGAVYIAPTQIDVDVKSTLDYYYRAGADGMGAGDRVRIEDPVFHGMRWSRWALLQVDAQNCTTISEHGYSISSVSVSTEGEAVFSLERSTDSPELHEYAWTDVTLDSGRLEPGQWVRVRFGDTARDNKCGHQTPDRSYQRVPWPSYEWLAGQATWQPIAPVPTFNLQHRPELAILSAAVPSLAGVGEALTLTVGAMDELGNPLIDWEGPVTVGEGEDAETVPLLRGAGFIEVPLRFDAPGVYRVPVEAAGVRVLSNPVEVTAEPPALRVYWGDIHTHHGHSYVNSEGVRVDENHDYARDVMGMDLGCESMKAHPIEIDGEWVWEEMQANCREYTVDGEYVSLLGVEWMSTDDGHHNLYFDSCEVPFGSHEQMLRLAGRGSTFAWMDALLAATGVRSVAVPHASMYTGHNWTDVDDARRTVAEIYSGWGSSMELDGRPGSIQEALSGGNRVGFLAASDNHKGWMGNLVSIRRFQPGLGAFWAPELTHKAIFEAMANRRTYGTTGPRILLKVHAMDRGERFEPGQDFQPSAPEFVWSAHGTESIEKVTVFAVAEDGKVNVQALDTRNPGDWDAEGAFTWDDVPPGDYAVWVEVLQADGNRAWSTPLWLNNRGCGCRGSGEGAVFLLPLVMIWGRRSRRLA